MNKKVVSVILVASILSVFMINFVSAMDFLEGIKSVGGSIIKILEPFFKFLFGGGDTLYATEGMLFAQILFFVIILGIIWLSLNKVDFFSEHRPILMIISLAVSVLAVRGISSTELIKMILFPYSALAVALTAGIPFVIYFIIFNIGFKDEQYSIVRRIAWIFFAVIFVGLWVYRGTKLGELHYIYLITAVGAVIMAWIDGTIQKFFSKIEKEKFKALNKREKIVRLKNLRDEAEKQDDNVLVKYYNKKLKKLR